MKRINHNVLFVIILCVIASLMIFPIFFKWANRIEPWVFGLPFATFWIVFLCLCMCFTMIAWYVVDSIKGYVHIDIEKATKEEMNKWKLEDDK